MKRNLCIVVFLLTLFFTGQGQSVTNSGTDFWIAFPPNTNLSATLSIFISSATATSGQVQSAYPGVNQGFSVVPGVVTQFTVPSGAALSPGTENKGIHITSNDPISVYGLNEYNMSTDAYMALPTNALGMEYRIVNYLCSIPNLATAISVVATQDGTSVTIWNHQTGATTNITLNTGQTYYLRDPASMHELTGSRIQANHPVAVFGSNEATVIPLFCSAADHIIEEMFPYYSWGKNFVTAFLAGRDNSGDYFRIVAADNATAININGTPVATINAGGFYETSLAGYNQITASNPVMVAQFAKSATCAGNLGDPFMMLIPPTDQFLTSYTICNVTMAQLTQVQHFVNVLAPGNALGTIYQDGVPIPASSFVQIGTTNYYAAQQSTTGGSHTFSSTIPFGVFVYGWAYAESYGYPGGMSLSPIASVDTITLLPDTAYGQLNVTSVCLMANVKDNLNNSVAGALVNFHVGGINPLLGTAYTDAAGNAQYCYTQTGTIPGTDYVYAQVLSIKSDSSVVFWNNGTPCVNPAGGGTIAGNQSGCGSFTPASLTNIQLPSGESGTLEFKWQESTTSGTTGFSDIPASNSPSYTPGTISQTTWYRRIARVDCKTSWAQAAISNTVVATVNTLLPVSVTVSPSATDICSGTSVTFTATPGNGGTLPAYQWKINGNNAANANNASYAYVPADGDVVTCELTSSETCTTGNPATSTPVVMTVHPNLPVTVSAAPSQNPVCTGTQVTFTATPGNGGTLPAYQWKINAANAANANNASYAYVPADGDVVTCVLNSSETCTSGNPAISNPVVMTVHPNLPVTVTATASQNPVCAGTLVTFTATPGNGGTLPAYQWQVNASNANNANNASYMYVPVNGDVVACVLTSSETCTTGNPATSAPVAMTVKPYLPVTVSVSASQNPVCAGTLVTFTATPGNGGTLPAYQWQVNAGNANNANNASYAYVPAEGDVVTCLLNSSETCTTGNPATSAPVAMTVRNNPVVTFSPCFDTVTVTGAKPIRLRGGLPLGGTYSGNGVSSGFYDPGIAGAGTHAITYTYTNVASCAASASSWIHQFTASAFTCGNVFTDLRDGKTYPTFHIGNQCWMSSNLDFGTQIPDIIPQSDNCIPEKYKAPLPATPHPTFYQWDELMLYSNTETSQGLCPPGWHIPSADEWDALLSSNNGAGRAGWPLKDLLLVNGFYSYQPGFLYLNHTWTFTMGLYAGSMYWTSTASGQERAIARGLNEFNPSVSMYVSSRGNAFSVRCLKD
ncbi:MAG: FISUMP domain-containing protein [Bacteroidota bacterium]